MRYANIGLWVLQVLLALFFALGSGAPKLLLPPEMLPMPIPLPEIFLKLIGTCEVLGALGLTLPGVLRTRPGITPIAASCLVLLTICAAVYQVEGGQPANAVFALGMGVLAAVVAIGRGRIAPLRDRARAVRMQVAA